jgi:DNA invertase Pin-like site-specific DNA recombinase
MDRDPTMQTRELREYSERRGGKVFAEYVDIGISGTKETRPELGRLTANAYRRRLDAVVVWKLEIPHTLLAILEAI